MATKLLALMLLALVILGGRAARPKRMSISTLPILTTSQPY